MNQVSDIVRKFFEDYERGSNAPDPELIASQYSDSFMFASPQGGQAVKKDDFLKALPKREGFFKTVGLTSSKIQSLEETRLDDNYVLVKVHWKMRFEKDREQPIVAEISATYILYQREDSLRIVFQLDHQDLMKRVQDLGLLPAKD
jgi:ketosteroid isomerase-like protein